VYSNGVEVVWYVPEQYISSGGRSQADGNTSHLKILFISNDLPAQSEHRELESEAGSKDRKVHCHTVLE
jgi:hypothetical protein